MGAMTCYNRLVRRRKAGVWDGLVPTVFPAFEGDVVMLDSICVRVHQHGATGKRGHPAMAWDVPAAASRALVDADGRAVVLRLTGWQATMQVSPRH